MELNKLVFPAPRPSYTKDTFRTLWFVPVGHQVSKYVAKDTATSKLSVTLTRSNSITNSPDETERFVPCLYLASPIPSAVFILYFHANAEDLGYTFDFASNIRHGLSVNVVLVEYPGYGVYGGTCSAEKMQEDAIAVFDHLVNVRGIKPEQILVMGRSIGSGPASFLAARRRVGGLIILSGYTSIKAVVTHLINSVASVFIRERFVNREEITRVECPVLILHGRKDEVIPVSHAMELAERCTSSVDLFISEEMTHNSYSLQNDIVRPMIAFLAKFPVYTTGKLARDKENPSPVRKIVLVDEVKAVAQRPPLTRQPTSELIIIESTV
eukprot:TRINITY_DN10631_c0_g2_i1.p1 TRINITY_DN10631_c0_g2~~TRINITY_DN10631_c0_g2_i1.p1  ORF type:complete len:326 (+),score=56.63 TRINITY_DN10631_c0_g2_i1:187-1164(+)